MDYRHSGVFFFIYSENTIMFAGKLNISGGEHVKWNEPDSERQILYFLSNVDFRLKKLCKLKGEYLGRKRGLAGVGGDERWPWGGWIWSKYIKCVHENLIRKHYLYNSIC